jgi:hypothetical protein
LNDGEIVSRETTTVIEIPIPREKIVGVQDFLLDGISRGVLIGTVDEQPLEHSFIPGAYARQMLILKGTLIVGKIHRYPCFNFIMRGRATVFSEDGIKNIVAPFFFVSQPGAKRIVLALEETLWITCHGTAKTDLAEIEEELICPSYDDLYPQSFIDHMKENAQ